MHNPSAGGTSRLTGHGAPDTDGSGTEGSSVGFTGRLGTRGNDDDTPTETDTAGNDGSSPAGRMAGAVAEEACTVPELTTAVDLAVYRAG